MTVTCPLCRKPNSPAAKFCDACKANLTLLSDLMTDVKTLLEKADTLRTEGQLAPAVQTYLDVLDADPTNAEARAALGPVLRALRTPTSTASRPLSMLVGAAIAAAAFAAGFWMRTGMSP